MREFTSGKNRTEQYLRTLQSLRELLEAQGEDAVNRAYAEAVAETCYRLFAGKGFKRSDGRLCVHRLLGKQCNLKDCVPPSGDHDTLWLQNGKPAIYVTQPYSLAWETMRKLVAFCENYGLKADVDAWPSFHFPGRVLSIHLRRQERQGQ